MPDLSPLRNVRTIEEGCISTEEKAKVVTAAWGTEFIQFLAAIGWYEEKDELDHYDIKKRTHCTRIIDEKDEFILFSNRPGANS